MSSNEENIRRYINDLVPFGYNLEVSVDGLLGVVKNHQEIIFTTAGMQSIGVVEAFVAGIVYSESKKKNRK